MSFDWHEYWQFAHECQSNATTMVSAEAALRAAMSRAYYSVFCRARNLAIKRGVYVPRNGQAHEIVMKYFKNSLDINEQKVGEELSRLKKRRRKADYDDVFKGDIVGQAHMSVSGSKQAHAIIATLR